MSKQILLVSYPAHNGWREEARWRETQKGLAVVFTKMPQRNRRLKRTLTELRSHIHTAVRIELGHVIWK